jgi:RNA polymerase sigma-70 factor, ECF subfamily
MTDANKSMPDQEYMVRLASGDDNAWAELYRRHYSGILRFCGNYAADLDESQDYAQDTFMKLKEQAKRFQLGAPLKPWLYKIARNVCLQQLRCKKEVQWSDSVFARTLSATVSGPSPATRLANLELDQATLTSLEKLSEEHRTVLLLKYVEALTREEIAEMLDIPEATVKSRLYYALQALRESLDAKY